MTKHLEDSHFGNIEGDKYSAVLVPEAAKKAQEEAAEGEGTCKSFVFASKATESTSRDHHPSKTSANREENFRL